MNAEIISAVEARKIMSSEFGDELFVKFRDWCARACVERRELPVPIEEVAKCYSNSFTESYVAIFLEQEECKWNDFWGFINTYEGDETYWGPKIAIQMGAQLRGQQGLEMLGWIRRRLQQGKILALIVEKAKTCPDLLFWIKDLLQEFRTLDNSQMLICGIDNVVKSNQSFWNTGVEIISTLYQMNPTVPVLETATSVLEGFYNLRDMKEVDQQLVITEIDNVLALSSSGLILNFIANSVLSQRNRLSILLSIAERTDVSCDMLMSSCKTCAITDASIREFDGFFKELLRVRPEYALRIFAEQCGLISKYVERSNLNIALMPWNAGVNFQSYATEWQEITLSSLEAAKKAKCFRPRSFLTGLNVLIFGQKSEAWFLDLVAELPNYEGGNMQWDGDLAELFEHLATLVRYKEHLLKEDSSFIREQAGVFVKMLMHNYKLSDSQLSKLDILQSKIELNFDVEAEKAAMLARYEQKKQAMELEKQRLLALMD